MGQVYPNPSTAKVIVASHQHIGLGMQRSISLIDTLGLELDPSSVIRYSS